MFLQRFVPERAISTCISSTIFHNRNVISMIYAYNRINESESISKLYFHIGNLLHFVLDWILLKYNNYCLFKFVFIVFFTWGSHFPLLYYRMSVCVLAADAILHCMHCKFHQVPSCPLFKDIKIKIFIRRECISAFILFSWC